MTTVVQCDICKSTACKPGKRIRIYPMPKGPFDVFQPLESFYDVCESCMAHFEGFFVKEGNASTT